MRFAKFQFTYRDPCSIFWPPIEQATRKFEKLALFHFCKKIKSGPTPSLAKTTTINTISTMLAFSKIPVQSMQDMKLHVSDHVYSS